MSFQCFICEQKFKRLQDRAAHIQLKKDDAHRQFFLDQEQNILLHFSETVQQRSHIPTHNSSLLPPALEVPSVQINDVDIGNLPSSRDMDIDQEDGSCLESDDDGSIASEEMGRVEDIEDLKNEAILSRSVDATARALLEDFNFTELAEIFDFIPDPDLDIVLEEGVTDPDPSPATHGQTRRTFVDDDTDSRTYRWHSTAGRVYRREPTVHARWKSLFGETGGQSGSAYAPFSSRIEWELAQWAIQEKISQKSFDRLLRIPQVILLLFGRKMILM